MTDYIEQYQTLAAAVVGQAVTDYKAALKRIHRHPFDTDAARIINDCERLFLNEIEIYSDLDGQAIMKAVKEMVGAEFQTGFREGGAAHNTESQ